MKKALALAISVLLIVGMLSTSAFAAQTTFNHLDIKTAAKFAYLDAFGTQQQVSITWNKQMMINYMQIFVGEGSQQNVVPTTTTSSSWGRGDSDEVRINGRWSTGAPVRVVIQIPVTALGLTNQDVADSYQTNASGTKILEFEGIYHWNDHIAGVSNICPNKSGLDVLINATALIHYAKYGTIEVKKVVQNADGSPVNDNTSFSFTIQNADASFQDSFTLQNGTSKKYEEIPVGTYYVEEVNTPAGYTVKGYNKEIVLKEANEYKTLTVTNVVKDSAKSSLTVSKAISESDQVSLPSTASFSFTLLLQEQEIGSFTLTKADILAGRDRYTFANLAPGSYTIQETSCYQDAEMDHQITATVNASTVPVEDNQITVTLSAGQDAHAAFTNAYTAAKQPEENTTLTIDKTVTGAGDTTKAFAFTVSLLDASGQPLEGEYAYSGSHQGVIAHNGQISLAHGQSITIQGLPIGTQYAISETDAQGYQTSCNAPAGVLTAQGATVHFTNHMPSSSGSTTVPDDGDGDPVTFSLHVKKEWINDSENTHPRSVLIQLYKNGIRYGQPVQLDDANSWSHTFSDLNPGDTWSVDEVNVPNGYTKTIQRDANIITIYNTKTADTPIPQTGGAAPSLLPTLALGTGLGICGLFKQKRRR